MNFDYKNTTISETNEVIKKSLTKVENEKSQDLSKHIVPLNQTAEPLDKSRLSHYASTPGNLISIFYDYKDIGETYIKHRLNLKNLLSLRGTSAQLKKFVDKLLVEQLNNKKITLEDLGIVTVSDALDFFEKEDRFQIQRLNLCYFEDLNDSDIKKISEEFPNITRLDLNEISITEDSMLPFKKMEKLKTLNISGSNISIINIECPQLEKLNLYDCIGYEKVSIKCPLLTDLNFYLNNEYNIDSFELDSLALENIGQIKANIRDLILSCPSLKTFKQSSDYFYTNVSLNCPVLEKFKAYMCLKIDLHESYTSLKEFSISSSRIKDIKFLENMQALENLELKDCYVIQNIKTIANIKSLKKLELGDQKSIEINSDTEFDDIFDTYLNTQLSKAAHQCVERKGLILDNDAVELLLNSPFENPYGTFFIAMMRCENRTNLLTDHDAIQMLQNQSELLSKNNPDTEEERDSVLRAQVHFYLAKMCIEGRSNLLNTEEAVLVMKQVSENPSTTGTIHYLSNYIVADMRYKFLTNVVSDDEAFHMLEKITKNKHISSEQIHNAHLMMAKMRIDHRTNLISDSEAIQSLIRIQKTTAPVDPLYHFANIIGIHQIAKAWPQDVNTSNFLLAYMCCNNRTKDFENITDDWALQTLKAFPLADFLRAKMRYENRTHLLTDDDAIQLLIGVTKNQNTPLLKRAQAALLVAKMCCENRSKILSDNQTVEILKKGSQDQNLSSSDRLEANFLIALMRYFNRTNLITDDEAIQLLREVSESQNAPPGIKVQANLLIDQMRFENRGI